MQIALPRLVPVRRVLTTGLVGAMVLACAGTAIADSLNAYKFEAHVNGAEILSIGASSPNAEGAGIGVGMCSPQ